MRINAHGRVMCAVFLTWCIAGCGSPQFSPSGRQLLKPLETAVSSKKPEWIDAAEKKIQVQYDADNISQAELKSLMAIVEKSRSGDWAAAKRELNAMIDGQRTTAYDMERLQEGQKNPAVAEHRKQARQLRR